jgi:cell division protein FtsB
MEDLLTNAFQSGNATAIIAAVVVYAIIWFQRNSTKKSRDDANENLKAEIAVLKNELEQLKSLDLATKLAQIQTDLSWIKEKLK